MLLSILFLARIYALTAVGVFATPVNVMDVGAGIAAVFPAIPALIVLMLRREGEWIKYAIVTAAVLVVSTMGLFLSHNIVLLYLYPVAIASLYFSARLNLFAIILSMTPASASRILGPYVGGITGRNAFGRTQSARMAR